MVSNGQTATDIVAIPLPVSLIDPSRLNRRCDEADADIAELARTIAENGLISPISARPRDGGRYEIICGERRWRAFRRLERDTITFIVKVLVETQAQIERIIENYQRRDPSFMEQGEAVAALMDLTDRDVSEVANRLGQSVSWVRRRAKLPHLIPAWREELDKAETPYSAIRDSVDKLEELAILPPATQQTILDSKDLRYIKTTKEMRDIIAKLFMDLAAKPWSRAWEKKAYSGSGKKRCDACMRRSDRQNALFADPDAPGKGKSMCLDPQCWKEKCLAWSRSLITDNPGMVPIRYGYCFQSDGLDEIFGIEPVKRYNWQDRDDMDTEREGYTAAVGVFVDGPEIGTTRDVWLEAQDEDDADGDGDASDIEKWREDKARKLHMRQVLADLIASDIETYLTNIDANATIPSVVLADRKMRATAWFGIFGYDNSDVENASLDDPDWNPLVWAWTQTTEHIAEHVAGIVAEDIAQLYNGDRDNDADNTLAATLIGMYAIPIDTITARATDQLYAQTQDDAQGDPDASDVEDGFEPDASVIAVDAETLTDADDFVTIESDSYLPALAEAQ